MLVNPDSDLLFSGFNTHHGSLDSLLDLPLPVCFPPSEPLWTFAQDVASSSRDFLAS